MSLEKEKMVSGFITRVLLLILLALIICTCSGPKLMLVTQTSEKLTDSSTYSGKLVKQTDVVTECAISKTVDRDLALWPVEKWLIQLQLVPMHDSAYCPNLGPMLRKCSQIKWYQYRSITRSFLNQYRTVWIDPRPSWHIGYPHQSSQEGISRVRVKGPRSSRDLIPQSIGKTPGTTRTMEKNSNSSSMTNPGNGKNPIISSTTGGSQRRH
jgi:hypothetical protein